MFSAVFKLNVKRFWWICALNAFLLAILFVIPELDNKSYYYFPDAMLNIFALIFGAINGWAVFGYLNSSRSVSLYHSSPASRNSIFAANVVFGAISSVLPHLVTAVFIPAVTAGIEHIYGSVPVCFGYILSRGAVYSLTLFALSCFSSMFSGHSAASKIFTPIFAILPFFFEGFLGAMREAFLLGTPPGSYTGFSEKLFFEDKMLPFIVLIPLLLLGAYIAYKLRPMEAAGEVVTYNWAKWIFVQGMGLCFGTLISSVAFFDSANFISITLIGLVFVFIALALLQKTCRVKGFIKHALVYAGIMAVLFAVFELDVTGYEKRIPSLENVKEVRIGSILSVNIPSISDPDLVSCVISAHKQLIEIEGSEHAPIYIEYTLKNGKTLRRTYKRPGAGALELMDKVRSSDSYKQAYFCLDRDWKNVSINDIEILDADAQKLKLCVEEELKKVTDGIYLGSSSVFVSIGEYYYIPIPGNMENTRKLCNEIYSSYINDGLLDKPLAEAAEVIYEITE